MWRWFNSNIVFHLAISSVPRLVCLLKGFSAFLALCCVGSMLLACAFLPVVSPCGIHLEDASTVKAFKEFLLGFVSLFGVCSQPSGRIAFLVAMGTCKTAGSDYSVPAFYVVSAFVLVSLLLFP